MGTESESPDVHLERARDALRRASDAADRTIQNQVDSVVEGIGEELGGHRTQDQPGPKTDRIAELAKKLDGLEAEASGAAGDHIETALGHCHEYLKQRGAEE